MSHVWAGDMDMRMAKEAGQLELKGNPILIRTITSWLRSGTFAHVRPQSGPINIKQSHAPIRRFGMQKKSKEFNKKDREIYAKA